MRSQLVGRAEELAELAEIVGRALDFQAPQLISVLGNQGTGKSRLVEELAAKVKKQGVRTFVARAVENGPKLGAVSSFLRERFGIAKGEAKASAEAKLRAGISKVFADQPIEEMLHFLGDFLGLSFPDSPFLQALGENPGQHDEIARTVLRRFIEVDCDDNPTLLVFDNLQWADDDTLELLSELGERIGGSPLVLIACARPELNVRFSNWGAAATDHSRIDLRNLDEGDAAAVYRELLRKCDLVPDDIVDDAVEMTGGNPAFLEQLVRLYLSNGTVDARGPVWKFDPDKAAETELPISIEEAIEARIANLEAHEREVLEKGAVFGNVFWLGAVIALSRIEADNKRVAGETDDYGEAPPELPDDPSDIEWDNEGIGQRIRLIVSDLVERDYLLELDPEDSTITGDTEYVFKHNLEREHIANSTEMVRLSRYHKLAAQWLESKLADQSEDQLEFIAQLYAGGGERARAAQCYLAGADKSRARYINDQAVELYRRGLATLDGSDAIAELDALHNLGSVLAFTGQVKEAEDSFNEMLRKAWLLDHRAKGGAAHGRLGRLYRDHGEYDRAMEHLRQANKLFEQAHDQRGIAATKDDMGRVHWLRGAYSQALDFHRQALQIRRGIGDRRSIALSFANIGRVHFAQGGFKAAHRQFREALDLRRDVGDLSGVVSSLCDIGTVHFSDGALDLAMEMFGEAYATSIEIGDKLSECRSLSLLGECRSALGDGTLAVENLMESISIATNLAHRETLTECYRRLADVYRAIGDSVQALDQGRRALLIAEKIGSRVHVGAAHRVIAEALGAGAGGADSIQKAELHFKTAIDVLTSIKNELEQARVYRSMAHLCERTGQPQEAAALSGRADEIYGRLRGVANFD